MVLLRRSPSKRSAGFIDNRANSRAITVAGLECVVVFPTYLERFHFWAQQLVLILLCELFDEM